MTTDARNKWEQELMDAVHREASLLKEAGEPLCGLGPSDHYAEAFDRYSQALKQLILATCARGRAITDWRWDGSAGYFYFFWEFGARLDAARHGTSHFVEMRARERIDTQKPLSEELDRLRAAIAYYAEMRAALQRWAKTPEAGAP